MGDEEERTVRARRRRRVEQSGPREDAEAPIRRREEEELPPSFPTGGGGAPPQAPSGGMPNISKMGGGGLLILLIILAILILPQLMGHQSSAPTSQPPAVYIQPTATSVAAYVQPTSTPALAAPTRPHPTTVAGASGSKGDKWLVMLYQDADDRVLEKDIFIDLNEAEETGSSNNVSIVAQVDRYRGGFRGDGNWTDTRRYYVRYDPNLDRLASKKVMDLGEANMADGKTLVDFVEWAVKNYPADHYVLILSDHGMGWPGGFTDPTARSRGEDNVPLARAMGDILYLREIDRSLAQIQQDTGIEKFDIIGLDACLMGMAEVYDTLASYARYAVASEETEPSVGWAYAAFLGDLNRNPSMSPRELASLIVKSYITDDQRIVDPKARADMLGQRGLFGVPPADAVAAKLGSNATLAAIDLQSFQSVMEALNRFAYVLQSENQRLVAEARSYALSYTSVFGRSVPPSYIDLANFALLIGKNTRNAQVREAAQNLAQAIQGTVVAEKHGRGKNGSHGISIYFPNSSLYRNPMAGAPSYADTALRFVQDSSWDEFLAFHYSGRKFNIQPKRAATVPDMTKTRAPGIGKISITNMRSSRRMVSLNQSTLLSADISGDNIGYIYLFAGYLDAKANSLFVADMDYLETDHTHTVDGVTYPDWGKGKFRLEFEWEPVLYGINDGSHSVLALFQPDRFGVDPDDARYAVDGIYTFADGERRYARLFFSNKTGKLDQVFGYADKSFLGSPAEITPSVGDSFTVLQKWFDLDSKGRMTKLVMQPGKTVTFGRSPLEWKELNPPSGTYVLGFIVEDLDGNRQAAYTAVKVKR